MLRTLSFDRYMRTERLKARMVKQVSVLAVVSGVPLLLLSPSTSNTLDMAGRKHPENGRIVFRRWLNGPHTTGDLFTINLEGTGLRRITRTPRAASTEPSPPPDGRWIVYMVIRHGDIDHGRLFRIRPNGSGKTELEQTCNGDCQGDGFPDWPTTGMIAFQANNVSSPRLRPEPRGMAPRRGRR
jgi:hypothetical protein